MSVVAPAGYGKTTVLAQWAERDGQAFAWVSVDEKDNDPKVLLSYVAEALDAVQPIDKRVFDALASPGSSVPGSVVPRLGSAFSSMTAPVVLVLDDVHWCAIPGVPGGAVGAGRSCARRFSAGAGRAGRAAGADRAAARRRQGLGDRPG